MPTYTILYDEPHEALWFRKLHSSLANASEASITSTRNSPALEGVLVYDRPDIILLDNGKPILVVEETVEVPSGHNVGQRFARIAAAAESGVPAVYFGPYVAKKHGGDTAGPRYMNLRLFHALDAMERVTGSAITTINWPVDCDYEVRRDSGKDNDVRTYMAEFFAIYEQTQNLERVNAGLIASAAHRKLIQQRDVFVRNEVTRPEQYDDPPASVEFLAGSEFGRRFAAQGAPQGSSEIVLYNIGMNNIRSDPYTGMAMLYRYLYVAESSSRKLILWFPNILVSTWISTARNSSRKDVRLFRHAADAILFQDGYLDKSSL